LIRGANTRGARKKVTMKKKEDNEWNRSSFGKAFPSKEKDLGGKKEKK
jgi:hypothetical protein